MKNKKMIVFLIINIILIGIICSLISIKKNLIKEKQVIKEMRESTQISDLQNQINQLNASQEEYAKNIQSYKSKLATAITNQKVITSENATIDEMVTNIGNILQARTKDATATADNITKGKTAYVNGKLITGNGADNNSYYNQGSIDKQNQFNLLLSNKNVTKQVLNSIVPNNVTKGIFIAICSSGNQFKTIPIIEGSGIDFTKCEVLFEVNQTGGSGVMLGIKVLKCSFIPGGTITTKIYSTSTSNTTDQSSSIVNLLFG